MALTLSPPRPWVEANLLAQQSSTRSSATCFPQRLAHLEPSTNGTDNFLRGMKLGNAVTSKEQELILVCHLQHVGFWLNGDLLLAGLEVLSSFKGEISEGPRERQAAIQALESTNFTDAAASSFNALTLCGHFGFVVV